MPVLPMSSVSAAPSLPTVATGKAQWAALFARVNNRASPALIQKWMGVNAQQAQVVMQDLVARGVVQTPVAGTAVATNPILPANQAVTLKQGAGDVARAAKDAVADLFDTEDLPLNPVSRSDPQPNLDAGQDDTKEVSEMPVQTDSLNPEYGDS